MANEVGIFNTVNITNIGSVNSVGFDKIGSVNTLGYVGEIPQDLSTGLVGYFNFEETSGTTLTNRKGATTDYPNGTAINTPTKSITGKKNYAWQFNGSNQYVSLGYNGYSFTNDFAISAWIYPYDVATTHTIVARYFSSTGYRCYRLSTVNNNVYFQVWNTSNTGFSAIYNAPLTQYAWTHLVASKVGTNMALYINDVSTGTGFSQENSAPTTIRTQSGSSSNLSTLIGATSKIDNIPDGYWYGYMDELALWNRGLTAPQVAYLYNGGAGRFYTPATGFV